MDKGILLAVVGLIIGGLIGYFVGVSGNQKEFSPEMMQGVIQNPEQKEMMVNALMQDAEARMMMEEGILGSDMQGEDLMFEDENMEGETEPGAGGMEQDAMMEQ